MMIAYQMPIEFGLCLSGEPDPEHLALQKVSKPLWQDPPREGVMNALLYSFPAMEN